MSSTSVTLSFTQVDDGTGQPAQYDVRYAAGPITWWSAASVTLGTCATPVTGTAIGTKLTCTVLGLSPSTTYNFQLVAFRDTLNHNATFGALSNTVSATTTAPSTPGTVTDLSASVTGPNAVSLSFTQVDDGTGQPAHYDVRSAAGAITWWTAASVTLGTCAIPVTGTAIGAKLTCTVLGLAPSTTYNFQLVAFRDTLNHNATFGALSNKVGATTAATVVAPVSSVSVVLNSSSLNVGQTTQAVATLKDSLGNVLTGRTIVWSSGSTAVATVDGNGLVTAKSAGSAVITATSEGKSGSATLTVSATSPPPVATVTVTLNSSSLTVGQTTQAVVTLKDSSGNTLTGRTVTYASGNTSVATVSSTGAVSALAAGTAVITATSEGKSGSATLTVTSPQQVGCASPQAGWIWCDDFEQDRTSSYFEYVTDNNSFVRAAGVGRNGSTGMRAHFAAGQVSAGALRLAFGKTPSAYFRPVDAGTANYRELYWRVYVKNQSGWIGGGADKLSRAIVFAKSDWSEAAIGHVWSGSSPNQNYLVIDPASGTDAAGNVITVGYNDFAHLRWFGATVGQTPIFDAAHVGQWYCVEAHMKLNTPGLSDGVFELRINGNLEAQRTGMNWLGSYQTYGINAVFLENYWNAGSPQSQERYLDDFVVSTQPIGC